MIAIYLHHVEVGDSRESLQSKRVGRGAVQGGCREKWTILRRLITRDCRVRVLILGELKITVKTANSGLRESGFVDIGVSLT